MAFEEALATWLIRQRWFAGKGRGLRDLAIVADTEVVSGDPELRHLIVTVSYDTTVDYYQVLTGLRHELPDELQHARIGPSDDGRQAYDGLHDAELTRTLLAGIAADESIGRLRMRTIPGASFETGLDSLVLGGEQSNTSLVYGEESILKVFRRLSPGPNPDLEVTTALARLGSQHVAEPFGWMETTLDGVPTSLAILSRYLRLASDGWSLAATSVRDLYAMEDGTGDGVRAGEAGGDFAGEAYRLGIATAQIHTDLSAAFGADVLGDIALRELTEQMFRKLDLAEAAVPELGRYSEMIGDAYSSLAKLRDPIPVQRVHGDYHLGQVMRTTETGWVVLDFEGEAGHPARAAPRPLLPAARRGRDAPFLRLRGQAPAHRPPGAVQPQRGRRRLGAAERERILRRVRGSGRPGPGRERRAAAGAAAGQGSVRSAVRGKAPTVLAADSA